MVFDSNAGVVKVRAGKAIVTIGTINMIALGVEMTFQRNVEVVPTLGEKRVLSIGEGQGTFRADSILSAENNIEGAFQLDGDGCGELNISITFQGGGCSDTPKSVTMHNCVASAVTVGAQGGRGYIAEGVQCVFTALELT